MPLSEISLNRALPIKLNDLREVEVLHDVIVALHSCNRLLLQGRKLHGVVLYDVALDYD